MIRYLFFPAVVSVTITTSGTQDSTTPLILGTATPYTLVTISSGTNSSAVGSSGDGSWAFQVPESWGWENLSTYSITATLPSGRSASSSLSIEYPYVSITSQNSFYTDTPTLTGNALPGDVVTVEYDMESENVTADPGGVWSLTVPSSWGWIESGVYPVTARVDQNTFATQRISIFGSVPLLQSEKSFDALPYIVGSANPTLNVPSKFNGLDLVDCAVPFGGQVGTYSRSYDLAASVISDRSVVSGPFVVNIRFNSAVTGFSVEDILVSNGSASDFSGSGTDYYATITPTQLGEVAVSIPVGVVSTTQAGPNIASDAKIFQNVSAKESFDGLPHTVTSGLDVQILNTLDYAFNGGPLSADFGTYVGAGQLTCSLSAPADTVAGQFVVTAVFSKSVNNFDLSDVVVTNGTAASFSGSGATYFFVVSPSALGIVTVSVPAGAASATQVGSSVASNTLSVQNVSGKISLDAEPFYVFPTTSSIYGGLNIAYNGQPHAVSNL